MEGRPRRGDHPACIRTSHLAPPELRLKESWARGQEPGPRGHSGASTGVGAATPGHLVFLFFWDESSVFRLLQSQTALWLALQGACARVRDSFLRFLISCLLWGLRGGWGRAPRHQAPHTHWLETGGHQEPGTAAENPVREDRESPCIPGSVMRVDGGVGLEGGRQGGREEARARPAEQSRNGGVRGPEEAGDSGAGDGSVVRKARGGHPRETRRGRASGSALTRCRRASGSVP